jgi:hypothetical protein
MSGMKPVRRLDGSPFMGDLTHYPVNPAGAAIFYGDPVKLVGGYIVRATGVATEVTLGVFMGCEYLNRAAPGGLTFSNYWNGVGGDAGAEIRGFVVDSPDVIYEVEFTKTGALAITDLAKRYTLTMGAGDASTGRSTVTLGAASATGPVYAMPLTVAPTPGDPVIVGGNYTYRVQVFLSLHPFAQASA